MNRNAPLQLVCIALLVCMLVGYALIDPWSTSSDRFDPAGIGVAAIIVGDDCGRMWMVERRDDSHAYRVVQVASPYVAGLDPFACTEGATYEVADMCGRRFALSAERVDRSNVERLVPRYPIDVDDTCLARLMLPPQEAIEQSRAREAAARAAAP